MAKSEGKDTTMSTMQDLEKPRADAQSPAAADHPNQDTEHGHGDHPHVVPLSLLTGVFVALLVLTWITVAVTWIDAGRLNVWIALGIAVIKAALVALYFMHLRWDSPFNAMVLIASLVFVSILIGATIHDSLEYSDILTSPEELRQLDRQSDEAPEIANP